MVVFACMVVGGVAGFTLAIQTDDQPIDFTTLTEDDPENQIDEITADRITAFDANGSKEWEVYGNVPEGNEVTINATVNSSHAGPDAGNTQVFIGPTLSNASVVDGTAPVFAGVMIEAEGGIGWDLRLFTRDEGGNSNSQLANFQDGETAYVTLTINKTTGDATLTAYSDAARTTEINSVTNGDSIVSDAEYTRFAATASLTNQIGFTSNHEAPFNVTDTTIAVGELRRLELNVRRHMDHDSNQTYEVVLNESDPTAEGNNRTDVTDLATVMSNNTSLVQVSQSRTLLYSTSDVSANGTAAIEASYDGLNDTENVVVANTTVNNLRKLPPWARLEATLDPGTDGNPHDHTFMIVMIATFTAIAGARLFTTFVGLGAYSTIFIAAWLIGYTTSGMLLVVLTIVGFVGLNLAANIDYAVR